ncbi:MAG: exodeoxyribonuclease VII large subunit, partial [Bacilli bacterium]|nr:exodeoxyribonuclease VII large subunit [Bacilli bacterium]
ALARAIFACQKPTISGVGHEADYTISDFVASKRAPTPTGAAVLVTKDQYQVSREINEKINLIKFYFKKHIEKKYYEYENLINRHHFKNFQDLLTQKMKEVERLDYNLLVHSPKNLIEKHFQKLNELQRRLEIYNLPNKLKQNFELVEGKRERLSKSLEIYLNTKEQNYLALVEKMNIVNPMNLLKKGYVLTYQQEKLIIRSENLDLDKELEIKYYDGNVVAKAVKKN